ncbi:MAG: B12-binding domain-containing radical SAM protein [Planctomycetota bacterium]|jgi:radical SAM superfamily enzyme YgiQ (UPF0313 family)
MKVLLSSVFGPYGVDDAYGRKENVMELFHNQVTREQGIFSLRFHHPSFGLYMIAENICAPAMVLDFPTEKRFVKELEKGYDYVGISFIMPNFLKAKRMAELVRQHAPQSQVILGGHGAAIPDVEDLIDCDYVCRGEGIRWFRELLGEDTDRPLRHPTMLSGFSKRVFGVPLKTDAAVLIPGLGCPNACRFCATSHFFGKTYLPFFDTGKELFDACRRIEERIGCRDFFIMDENFLKRPERAREMMRLMEEQSRYYRFALFSSAETVSRLGAKFLARLGIYFLWVGVESKQDMYEKNRGIDLQAMIGELRDHGISVLASGILFLEHHDKESIWEDIRFIVNMEADFVQFMQLGPVPRTPLFTDYRQRGLLNLDVPFEEWHGQHRIWFDHPHFTPKESEDVLRAAFRYDFDTQGASILRMCDTALRGVRTLARYPGEVFAERTRTVRERARDLWPALAVLNKYAHTEPVRALTEKVIRKYKETLGSPTLKQTVLSWIGRGFAARETARVAAGKAVYQPRTLETRYRMSFRDLVAERLKGKNVTNRLNLDINWLRGSALVNLGGTIDKVNSRTLAKKIRTYIKMRDENLVLILDRLTDIEDQALTRLLKMVRRHRDRLKVVFREGAETVHAAIAALPEDLSGLIMAQ